MQLQRTYYRTRVCQTLQTKSQVPNLTPEILALSVDKAKYNEFTSIKILGSNFFPNNTYILFGNKKLEVSFYSTSTIVINIQSFPPGVYVIKAVNVTNFAPLNASANYSNSVYFTIYP